MVRVKGDLIPMYKLIINGIPTVVTQEEAAEKIREWEVQHHIFSIDEFWKTRDTIYLNDAIKE